MDEATEEPQPARDYVWKFKEKVDYAEILRMEGIELPSMDSDDASVDEVEVTEEACTEDVQEGTPVQANATVANYFSTQADMSEHELTRADTHGHAQQGHEQDTKKTLQRHEHGKAEEDRNTA
jgi:ABC-type proline/glycine betaine transport system ATPase subunit